jgi:nucleotide-binding universal stress UspA family protein
MEPPMDARPPLSRILFATDLTHDGDLAFAHALRIVLPGKGELMIVHAAHRSEVGKAWDQFPRVRASLVGWGLLEPGVESAAVEERLGLHVRKIDVPDNRPDHGVLEILDRRPCDLLVLATHARDGISRLLNPSVAESIAREGHTPTLVLPATASGFVDPATGAVRLHNILIPVDSRPSAIRALALAWQLSAQLGADSAIVHLLHVGPDFPDLVEPVEMLSRVRRRQMAGPVVDAILETAEAVLADLIVMPTRGHDSLTDILRGSTTEQVLHRSGLPVLMVPSA